MYAVEILSKCLCEAFEPMHASRACALLGAVSALLAGRRLTLMELARSWPDATRVRAPLKRLDRLLGNEHLEAEQYLLYEAMSSWLLTIAQPVIAIDWSPLDAHERFQVLRAGIVLKGRTLTLLQEVHSTALLGNQKVERAFLKRLKSMMPQDVTPIIMTDAGFRTPWFRAVRALGWDYIGRLRGTINVRFVNENTKQKLSAILAATRGKPESLGTVEITLRQRWQCQMVCCREPNKGRKLLTKHGTVSRAGRSRKAQRRASEPCVLVTSLTCLPHQIVNCYRQRMQIEESFRDLKSERYGVGFELSLTRGQARIAILLLIHALATLVAYLVAISVPARELTVTVGGVVSKRRHYSQLWLGWQLLCSTWMAIPPLPVLLDALRSIRPYSID
jgi:hypothetical protein